MSKMEHPLQIEISKDHLSAKLLKLRPHSIDGKPITTDDICMALAEAGVVNGLLMENISRAINISQLKGVEQNNIEVARSTQSEEEIYFGAIDKTLSMSEVNQTLLQLNNVKEYCISLDERQVKVEPLLIFCKKEEVLFQISGSSQGLSVTGEPLGKQANPINVTENILIKKTASKVEYISNEDGFLFLNSQNQLDIVPLIHVRSDNLIKYLVLAEAHYGNSELLLFYSQLEESSEYEKLKTNTISNALEDELPKHIVIQEAKPAIDGQDGQLSLHVEYQDKPSVDMNEQIDFKTLSPYQQIKKGTPIATIVPPSEPVDGEDVLGAIIPAKAGEDVEFNSGSNISATTQSDGSICYSSDIDGILFMDENSASVEETLEISNDVCLETGHIEYDKNIIIKGGVNNGFTVVSGSDLYIHKGIDEGAVVKSLGNLTIGAGVLGANTKIYCQGDCTILGFVQDATIICKGNLIVEGYIFNARVYCQKLVTVQGKGIKGETRGAIVGGLINGLEGIKTHSVGHSITPTKLIAGVDIRVEESLVVIEKGIKSLDKIILKLMNEVGFDIYSPLASAEMKKLSTDAKAKVKSLLLKIKEAGSKRDMLLKKKEMTAELGQPTIDSVRIWIDFFFVADVSVRLYDSIKILVSSRYEGSVFKNHKGALVMATQKEE